MGAASATLVDVVPDDDELLPPPQLRDDELMPPPSTQPRDNELMPPPSTQPRDNELMPPPLTQLRDNELMPPPPSQPRNNGRSVNEDLRDEEDEFVGDGVPGPADDDETGLIDPSTLENHYSNNDFWTFVDDMLEFVRETCRADAEDEEEYILHADR